MWAYVDSLESTERKLNRRIDLGPSRIKRIIYHYELLARDLSPSFAGRLTDDIYLIHLIYIRPYIIGQNYVLVVCLNSVDGITLEYLIDLC